MEKVNWKNREDINRYHREYTKRKTPTQKRNSLVYQKEWTKNHPGYHNTESRLEKERKYDKLYCVCSHNSKKNIYISKRQNPFKDYCELCGSDIFVQYHHWDDNKPQLGMWLCKKCHRFADSVEAYVQNEMLRENYLGYKKRIENGKV